MIISTILPIILNENIEKMSIVCQREDNLMLIYIIQLLKILSNDLNLIVICGIILSGDKMKDRELIARIIINI